MRAISPGQLVGHYRIASILGAGGMGEVYRATDTRLGRTVAIKVLPAREASEPDRLRRLEDEARAASALSHPNIVTVYEIGRSGSIAYIATELVEGETLRDVLVSGPLPTNTLLDIAVQLADGLSAAHDAGIIHRDLTPANVMVTPAGVVKLLDFGLAKLETPPCGGSGNESVTFESPARGAEIVGTAGYMSPEQTRGGAVDFRSDQFALGAVLYEMATGRRAFSRKTDIETLCAVLNDEPEPIHRVQPGLPPSLRWIIERCLAKTPGQRYRSTKELARELRDLRQRLAEMRRPTREMTVLTPIGSVLTALVAVSVSLLILGSHPGRRVGPPARRR
ncbi:MAG: serine/threonine-protein kinase [Thermoanaerobaculia bacterium]